MVVSWFLASSEGQVVVALACVERERLIELAEVPRVGSEVAVAGQDRLKRIGLRGDGVGEAGQRRGTRLDP